MCHCGGGLCLEVPPILRFYPLWKGTSSECLRMWVFSWLPTHQYIEFLAPSSPPCLPGRYHASCHDESLNLPPNPWICQQIPINVVPYRASLVMVCLLSNGNPDWKRWYLRWDKIKELCQYEYCFLSQTAFPFPKACPSFWSSDLTLIFTSFFPFLFCILNDTSQTCHSVSNGHCRHLFHLLPGCYILFFLDLPLFYYMTKDQKLAHLKVKCLPLSCRIKAKLICVVSEVLTHSPPSPLHL